jgi:hypothetical protein
MRGKINAAYRQRSLRVTYKRTYTSPNMSALFFCTLSQKAGDVEKHSFFVLNNEIVHRINFSLFLMKKLHSLDFDVFLHLPIFGTVSSQNTVHEYGFLDQDLD